MPNSEDEKPLPQPTTLMEAALRHTADGLFSQSAAVRELAQELARNTAALATVNANVAQLIAAEQEERLLLRDVHSALAAQGVRLETAADEVERLREETGKHLLPQFGEAGDSGTHRAIGKGVVWFGNFLGHRVVPWVVAGLLGALHAMRSLFHP